MNPKLYSKTAVEIMMGAAAALFACCAVWVALRLRVTGNGPPYLMIIAQEVLFGHHQEFMDFPASVIMHTPPLLAFHWLGWPIVFSWNLYMTALCAVSAAVFAFRMDTARPGLLWCLWFALTLLLFDDVMFGQREFLFSILWFPYLMARFRRPIGQLALAVDILCGVLLSVSISAKFYFAAFVLLIDIPLLLLRRSEQSYPAFGAMLVGGLVQGVVFLMRFGTDLNELRAKMSDYYETVGIDYAAVWHYLHGVPAVYLSMGVIALVLVLHLVMRRPAGYALACAGSGAVCLTLAIMQGHPRPYTLIPLFLAALACSLEAAFSSAMKPTHYGSAVPAIAVKAVMVAASVAVTGSVIFGDSGLMRAVLMRYVWHQPDYARIGPVPEDEYMLWVRKHVVANEDIDVIALQYGGTSAFDPVLSTIRLGRRVNSANPILQFPLRAALVLGDRARIEAAWDALIGEIAAGSPAWVIIRRTTPAPMAPDFVKTIEAEPRFYSWLTAHYSLYDEFGPYVAYRRTG